MRRFPGILPLILVYSLYSVAFFVYLAVWSYYTQERFGWTPQTIGLSLALFGIMMAIVQGGMIHWIIPRFGERKTVIAGHVFDIPVFGLIAAISSGRVALILTTIVALGAAITPAIQAIMSKRVGDDAQGELQGVLSSAHAIAIIVSPLTMTGVFAVFTSATAPVYMPGAPFVLSMVLILAGLIVFARSASWRKTAEV